MADDPAKVWVYWPPGAARPHPTMAPTRRLMVEAAKRAGLPVANVVRVEVRHLARKAGRRRSGNRP